MTRKYWTNNEFDFIKEHYTQLTNAEIAVVLKRTESSISHKIHKLHLQRRKPVIMSCFYCAKQFRVTPRQVRRGGGKYCSRNCQRLAHVIDENKARQLFDEWKRSRLPLQMFSSKKRTDPGRLTKAFKNYLPDQYEMQLEEGKNINLKYHKGRQFEYAVRDFYIQKGYFVLRSPRSLGLIDLVAIKKGEILFIQCKLGGAISASDKKSLILLAKSVGAQPLLATKDRIYTHEIIIKELSEMDGRCEKWPSVNLM